MVRTRTVGGGSAREPLNHVLGTRAKVACLRVLSTSAGNATQREVARRAGIQHRSAQLALDELVTLGVARRTQGGRDYLVSLSHEHHLSAAIQQLFRSESEHFRSLRTELAASAAEASRQARPRSLVLFGSVARGDDRPDSDVDTLVITGTRAEIEPVLEHLTTAADRIRVRYGHAVRPIAYSLTDARRRWRRREPPFPEIMRDHIVLVGPPLMELLGG